MVKSFLSKGLLITKGGKSKKTVLSFILTLVLVFSSAITAFASSLQIKDSVGWDVFTGSGYRYGTTSFINPDNSIDMWMAGPGANGAWDYIYYKRSTDGGHTWGPEVVALQPTAGSRDALSTCDPGVIKIGSYYYIGYTSTEDGRGTNNKIYVARSTSPSSGFQKWNGSGWGGNPQPFITYGGDPAAFGAGEPSFVEKDGTLYIYFTWIDGNNSVQQTRVATVSASDLNWPAHITYRGVAITREASGNPANGTWGTDDSTDIKYVDSLGKWIGVAVGRRLNFAESYTVAYESDDGLSFTRSTHSVVDGQAYSHNAGISGTPNGHLDTTKNNFVTFAYGPDWGNWHLHLSPIVVSAKAVGVSYQSHVQNVGWQRSVTEGLISGTLGFSKRNEAVKILLTNAPAGMNITYQAHVQNIGWQTAVSNGALAGTEGQSLGIEAIKIALTGTVPTGYHVKYRVHQAYIGWGPWVIDNAQAGITGQAKSIQALQIIVYKD